MTIDTEAATFIQDGASVQSAWAFEGDTPGAVSCGQPGRLVECARSIKIFEIYQNDIARNTKLRWMAGGNPKMIANHDAIKAYVGQLYLTNGQLRCLRAADPGSF